MSEMTRLMEQVAAASADPDERNVPDFVAAMLNEAVTRDATDAYLEPAPQGYRIRFRVDGVFEDVEGVSLTLAERAISRLKVLSKLVVYRREVPQEGHLRHTLDGVEHDVRASFFPTVRGERAVCRLFRRSLSELELGGLGLPEAIVSGIEQSLSRPQGLLLVAGPAGSGKTTTLYACLAYLLKQRGQFANLVSVEDPVERELPGVHQTAVNTAQDLTYARALRSLLRQDPEVLLLGEIRDSETAGISVEAGLTGHLVLTSVHAADGPDAFLRLVSLGVEPFMAASAVAAVLVLRLVRRLCPSCRRQVSDREWEPAGCDACRQTGFDGRLPLAELLPVDADTSQALRQGLSSRELARQLGDRRTATLKDCAEQRIGAGETSRGEACRVLGNSGP